MDLGMLVYLISFVIFAITAAVIVYITKKY